ncbi:MAG TPA: hypothetical protein VGY56_14195 [Verrucomicrobiae bacterium]|nr:hypothetical protein [Verrucomicrobiae bacterium]
MMVNEKLNDRLSLSLDCPIIFLFSNHLASSLEQRASCAVAAGRHSRAACKARRAGFQTYCIAFASGAATFQIGRWHDVVRPADLRTCERLNVHLHSCDRARRPGGPFHIFCVYVSKRVNGEENGVKTTVKGPVLLVILKILEFGSGMCKWASHSNRVCKRAPTEFDVVSVSLDEPMQGPQLLQFMKDKDMPWRQIYDGHALRVLVLR